MDTIVYRPIGVIHSPFKEPKGTPIQPVAASGVRGTVELFSGYAEGLKDLDGFSHVMLIYHFHMSADFSLLVRPFLDDTPRGLFSTRAPARPNSIGVSVVDLDGIDGATLLVRNVDIVDGTPLLDIKPYVPEFDSPEAKRIGWLEDKVGKSAPARDDGRFAIKKAGLP
ncbi:MAG: tRNA (N6-threonylcarbamoyladenosine(37)-N6)-methyltransferase TrmO [Deltaproteobacteria bacterium]|nr:tRNA (N6-threonylcarbamoyladenosine(37)-N6)-methyltransferase TrmO [Deltaproteobacteria bacterium]MBZ0219896.1 tRNA (N6-threonylcarbamoyladenosine(37)-N6)-methyltransferase TrmO [Deltaproteobacteria bacterium]